MTPRRFIMLSHQVLLRIVSQTIRLLCSVGTWSALRLMIPFRLNASQFLRRCFEVSSLFSQNLYLQSLISWPMTVRCFLSLQRAVRNPDSWDRAFQSAACRSSISFGQYSLGDSLPDLAVYSFPEYFSSACFIITKHCAVYMISKFAKALQSRESVRCPFSR